MYNLLYNHRRASLPPPALALSPNSTMDPGGQHSPLHRSSTTHSQQQPQHSPSSSSGIRPFNFLKRSSSSSSKTGNSSGSGERTPTSPAGGFSQQQQQQQQEPRPSGWLNRSRSSFDAQSRISVATSSGSGSGGGRSTSPSAMSSASSSSTAYTRKDGSGGRNTGHTVSGLHPSAGHSRSAQPVQPKKSIYDMPNPDEGFDLIETIGKGSFGVVHRAYVHTYYKCGTANMG